MGLTATAKSLQSCPTLCGPIDGSPPGSAVLGFSRPEHRSGCHFLLQCMKVKSQSEFAQSCPTLRDPMECSPPGSSVNGILQAILLEWGAIAFSVSVTRSAEIGRNEQWNLNSKEENLDSFLILATVGHMLASKWLALFKPTYFALLTCTMNYYEN